MLESKKYYIREIEKIDSVIIFYKRQTDKKLWNTLQINKLVKDKTKLERLLAQIN